MFTRARFGFLDAWGTKILALLLAGYCLWPARENPLLTGLPIGAVGLAALLAIVLAIVFHPPQPPAWLIGTAGALIIVKIIASPFLLPDGWGARYYSNERFEGNFEPSLDFKGEPWTRIDRRIDFKGDTFPVHFFNTLRYNFSGVRRSPPMSAHYNGYFTVEQPVRLRAQAITTNGVEVLLDGKSILARAVTEAGNESKSATVPLESGPHRLDVRYVAPPETPRKLAVKLWLVPIDVGARREPSLRPFPTTAAQESRARVFSWLMLIADSVVLVIVGVCLAHAGRVWWGRPTGLQSPNLATAATLVTLSVLLVAVFVGWHRIPSALMFIPTGVDAIGYEDNARHFLRGDWLLNWPDTLMHRIPIKWTLGYPTMMTAAHVIFGESIWSVLLMQDWLLWAAVFVTAAIAVRLGGWPAGVIAFLGGAYLRFYFFWPAHYLLRDTLAVFLNALLVFTFTSKTPLSAGRAALIGGIGGYNYFNDLPNLITLPLLVWFVFRMAAPGLRRVCLLAFAGAWLVFFLIVPTRNVLVTGVPTLVPAQGSATLWMGNTPPPGVYTGDPADHREGVKTYLWREPRHFATNILHKICYALGLYSPVAWREGIIVRHSLIVLASWILAAAGLMTAIRVNPAPSLLIALVAAVRGASVIVFFPDYRYVIPVVFTLLPIAAVSLVALWRFRPIFAIAVLLGIAGEHYVLAKPQLGIFPAWPHGRLIGPSSYGEARRGLAQHFPRTTRLKWTFPAHLAVWKPGPGVGVIADVTPMFQNLHSGEALVSSPPIGVPAPLVETIEIEAAFTGWQNFARFVWYRNGARIDAFFPVDQTGVTRTYSIPVWQSREWHGVVDRFEIHYQGDTIEPERIEMMTYSDVPPRDASAR
jgi:hypothetical protein